MKFTIPGTRDELDSTLAGIDQLLTATQHKRAGIVYAWTAPGEVGRPAAEKVGNPPFSIKAFARLGLVGLRHPEQVREYRAAWERIAELLGNDALLAIRPGDMVELPDDLPDWKAEDGVGFGEPTADVQARVFRSVLQDQSAVREAIKDRPEMAVHLAQRTLDIPASRVVAESRLAPPIEPREFAPLPPAPARDHRADLVRGVNLIVGVVQAIQSGAWTPSGAEGLLLHAVALLINDIDSSSDALFADIESYLEEVRTA